MLHLFDNALYDACGRRFDPHTYGWLTAENIMASPAGATPLSAREALLWQQKQSGTPLRGPVAVIGPREAEPDHLVMAHEVGFALAGLGMHVLCGGRQGVMDATCRGVAEGGGVSVGLLPEGEWTAANPYVTVPVATGIGIARNALIARAALCVIAIGGGLGTISEIALALQFGKRVLTLCRAPEVPGAQPFAAWADLEPVLCQVILKIED